jgi:hypothetical protein
MTKINTDYPTWTEMEADSWEKLIEGLHTLGLVPRLEEAGGHRRSSYFF